MVVTVMISYVSTLLSGLSTGNMFSDDDPENYDIQMNTKN